MIDMTKINFDKMMGLVPAVIVDENNSQVLMTGFLNMEALEKTMETGLVTFYSRTKKRLWTKGETSGNFLIVKDIRMDCDNDSLLIYAEPKGATCHSGAYSCFGEKKKDSDFLKYLYKIIKQRKKDLPEESYTAQLFKTGLSRISQKVGEEAVETVIASMKKDKKEIIDESSDLIYHLMVMLAEHEIEYSEVVQNLASRHVN